MQLKSRPTLFVAALALSIAIGGCTSSADKADAYEAMYDRMMPVRAYPVALKAIMKSISYDDSSARRYNKLAELQLLTGDPAGAARSFQAALDLDPSNIDALENLSILTVRAGQFDVAKQYVQPLLALSANDPAGLLASGAIALNERRYDDAIGFAERIITGLPDRPDGYVLKARALDGSGRTKDAIAGLEKRAQAGGDIKDILAQLMVFYRKIGDVRGIRATAIRMMPILPDDPRYALESARAYADEGKAEKSEAIIAGLTNRFKGDPNVLAAIGNFWRETQPATIARAKIARLAAESSPAGRGILADQLVTMGDSQSAVALLAPLARSPAITSANVDIQTRYARALLANGRTAEARARVDSILAFDPANPDALLIRAKLKLLAHDFKGALNDAQLVTQHDDQNEEAALLVAQIYVDQGNQLLAASAFGDARQRFPHSTRVLQQEVNWLLSQNRAEEAAERAAAFFHRHPRDGAAAQLYRRVCAGAKVQACGPPRPSVSRMLGL